jgi:hypothetical protein
LIRYGLKKTSVEDISIKDDEILRKKKLIVKIIKPNR